VYGIEFQYNQKRYSILNYNNSQKKNSTLYVKKDLWKFGQLEYGYFYGGATGYQKYLIPIAAPLLVFDYKRISTEFACLNDSQRYLCAFSVRIKF